MPHKRENEGVPLKVFLKCSDCNEPLTGYIVKKKNLYYYKCRKVGCKCNKSAKEMHRLFLEELGKYQVKESLIDAIIWKLEHDYNESNKDSAEKEIRFQNRLTELDNGTLWGKSGISVKERLQKLVFPEGLAYDREKGAFRTPKVNLIFRTIDYFTNENGGNKKGLPPFLREQSLLAEREGFPIYL